MNEQPNIHRPIVATQAPWWKGAVIYHGYRAVLPTPTEMGSAT